MQTVMSFLLFHLFASFYEYWSERVGIITDNITAAVISADTLTGQKITLTDVVGGSKDGGCHNRTDVCDDLNVKWSNCHNMIKKMKKHNSSRKKHGVAN